MHEINNFSIPKTSIRNLKEENNVSKSLIAGDILVVVQKRFEGLDRDRSKAQM